MVFKEKVIMEVIFLLLVVFRYDNPPDPQAKKIETFPYHKHLKNDKLVESLEIIIEDVLKRIEGTYTKRLKKEGGQLPYLQVRIISGSLVTYFIRTLHD